MLKWSLRDNPQQMLAPTKIEDNTHRFLGLARIGENDDINTDDISKVLEVCLATWAATCFLFLCSTTGQAMPSSLFQGMGQPLAIFFALGRQKTKITSKNSKFILQSFVYTCFAFNRPQSSRVCLPHFVQCPCAKRPPRIPPEIR